MSFGKSASVRLDANGKKPVVFWQQQQNEATKSKKKFSYKHKGNKIPLRDSLKQEESEPVRNERPPPKRNTVKPESNVKPAGNTQKQNARPSGNNNKGKAPGKSKEKKPVPEDKVTLTQTQFDRILETIGELTLLAEEKENTGVPVSRDLQELNTSVDINLPDPGPQPASQTQPEVTTTQPQISQPAPADPSVPVLDITSPRYPDPRSVPQGPVTGEVRSSLVGVPFAHMTKAERKRLEWERQKDENAALQKQVDHTEKLHTVNAHQAATTANQQPAAQNNKSTRPPPLPITANPAPPGINSVPQSTSLHPVNSQPTSVQGLKPSSGPGPGSSGIRIEPTSVPGLSLPQPTQAAPATSIQPNIAPSSVPHNVSGVNTQPQAVVYPAPSIGIQQPVTTQSNAPVTAKPPVATRGPLTKAEIKRLQWEKERAELSKQTDWDPWGKPGAGAPIKDTSGNVLADYSTRKEEAIRQSFEDVARRNPGPTQVQYQTQTQPTTTYAINQPPPQSVNLPHQQPPTVAGQPQTVAGQPPTLQQDDAPPAAIRSSFNVGAIAPDENKYLSVKEQQRRQWLADLEKQREEQRLRKLQQLQKDAELDMKDLGYQDNYKPTEAQIPQAPPPQPQNTLSVQQPPPGGQPSTYQPTAQLGANQLATTSQPPQQSMHAGAIPSGEPSQPQTDTFLRGQNVALDHVTRRELEEKRKKQLEYQEYIKSQIAEKERSKQAEREKKWREELELEQKLQRERDEVQNQNRADTDRARQREESDRRRTEALKSAMEQEKERAEWEKHEKRMLKLRKGGHDVSGYHATFQSKHTPRDGATSVLTVAPSYVPGLGNIAAATTSSHRDNIPSQMTSYPSPLPIEADARSVDVRSSHQLNETSTSQKEFGVQADLLGLDAISRESTDIEYKGPIKKKVRVKSAAELKALKAAREKKSGFGSSVARPTEPPKSAPVTNKQPKPVKPILKKTYKKPVPVSKRPAWGANSSANKKKVVKQSERDPYYEEKKRQSEERGLLRQQMLLEIAEQEAPLVSNKSTAAARARSRSKGRGEESEFEAPGAVHVSTTKVISRSRSRSPGVGATGHRSRVDSRSDRGYSSQRSNSPPVPALKNRITTGDVTDSGRGTPASYRRKTPTDYPDNYNYENYSRNSRLDAGSRNETTHHRRDKMYTDTLIDAPVQNGQFVPFIRSTNILDPAQAEEPLPLSREPSMMQRARQAYVQEHEPAKYGTVMENFEDSRLKDSVPAQAPPVYNKDPIINPSVVKDHPSQRQNRILQQLSDLRKGLMQKQRELEVGLQAEEVAG